MKALKIIILILVVLFMSIGVPILINEMYNIGGYTTHWGAADVLTYYGAILGGGATILAIYLTIKHENKKLRNEIDRRESERKKEVKQQRAAFIASNLRHMVAMLDISRMLNRFRGELHSWTNEPTMVYRFFDEVYRTINIDVHFPSNEKTQIATEFDELKSYASRLSDLLWDVYNLLINLKSIKRMEEITDEMNDVLSKRVQESKDRINQNQSSAEDEKATLNLLDEMQKNLDSLQGYRKESNESLSKVIQLREEIEQMHLNEFENLIATMQAAINKLEKQIEVDS